MGPEHSRWRRALLTVIGIAVAAAGITGLILVGYSLHLAWTGFMQKSLWDWLQLLLVPLVLALGVWMFTVANNRNGRRIAWRHEQRAQELAADQQREALLQDFLTQLSVLLVDKDLRGSDPESAVRSVARALTLTTLPRLDERRKRSLLRFLYEADLIGTQAENSHIPLRGADLHRANLQGANLSGADLSQVDMRGADLQGARLHGANLSQADLQRANLSEANLHGAILHEARLNQARLSKVDLHETNLQGVNLSLASLTGANLSQADLQGANLSGADLRDATLREAKLNRAILSRTKLNRVDLSLAEIKGADLQEADLREANLVAADLRETNLSGADLRTADVREVQIIGANLSHARLSKSLASRVEREQVPPANRG